MRAFCPFCEKEYNNLEVQTRYEITTLNGVTAEWQKKYITCPNCGEELYNGKLHDANLRVVYAACKVSDIDKPVEDLCDYVLKLRMENAALRERLEKAIELPSGDRVWYITKDEEGQESYIIPKPTSSLTVEELKYEMDKKYFSTREAAEARLKETKENAELRTRLNKERAEEIRLCNEERKQAVKEFVEEFKSRYFFMMTTYMKDPIYQCTGDEIDRLVKEVCGE